MRYDVIITLLVIVSVVVLQVLIGLDFLGSRSTYEVNDRVIQNLFLLIGSKSLAEEPEGLLG